MDIAFQADTLGSLLGYEEVFDSTFTKCSQVRGPGLDYYHLGIWEFKGG
jgi:hypothetical protein